MRGAPYRISTSSGALVLCILAAFLTLSAGADVPFVVPDPTFPAGSGPDYFVRTVAIEPDGGVLIGGLFTNVNHVLCPYLGRLNSDGSTDTNFTAAVDGEPTRISPLPDGMLLISGGFSNVSGVLRPGLARLQSNGSVDLGFAPPQFRGPTGPLTAVPASAGSVFVSGGFTNVGGQAANHLVRLNDDGSVDLSFTAPLNWTNTASLLAVQADDRPLVYGSIPNPTGPSLTNLFRFNTNGTLDTSFQCEVSSLRVMRIVIQPDGKLLAVAGSALGTLAGPAQLLRLNTNGSIDITFKATFDFPGFFFNGNLSSVELQKDGRILVTGTFLRADGLARGKIARLEPNGGLDYCFDVPLGFELNPSSLVVDDQNRVVVGGFFSGLQGQSHPFLMRLIPPTNCPPAIIQLAVPSMTARQDVLQVRVPVVREGGQNLAQTVGFMTRDGSAVGGVDYQTASGSLQFQPGQRSQFITVPLLASSFVGAKTFELVLNQAGPDVTLGALTNTTVTLTSAPPGTAGAADTNYLVQLDGEVRLIVPLSDGSAVIAGGFTNVNGQPSPNLARLLPGGATDPGFTQGLQLDGTIYSMVLDSLGRLLVAGDFRNVRGVWRPGLARLGVDGFLDAGFAPFALWPTNAYGATQVMAVSCLPDGTILCGGNVPVSTYNSTNFLLKLSLGGQPDPSFNNPPVYVGTDGLSPLATGDFLVVGQGLGNSLVRLRANGTLDLGFLPPADLQFAYYDGIVRPLPDGRVVASGFNSFSALPTQRPVWRLNPDGSLDTGFSLAAANGMLGKLSSVYQLSSADDGRLVVFGYFDDGTNAQQTLARITENGSFDFSFDAGLGLKARATSSTYVNAVARLPQGGWLVGGDFGGYDGFNQSYLVKVLPESLVRPLTFQFSLTNLSVWETNGLINLTVWRRGDASSPASVTVRTVDGTAVSNLNYTPIDVRLDFAPGEWSKTVSLNILQDHAVTGTEQFTIQLEAPDGGFSLGGASSVTVQIKNNDAAVAFISSQFHAFEQDGFALGGVTWQGPLSSGTPAVINIVPITGNATDLGTSAISLQYGGRTTNWFRIPLVSDPRHQSVRTFRLDLVPGGGLLPGSPSNSVLVLDDLDYATSPARGVAGVVEAIAGSPQGGVYLAGDFMGVHGVSRVRVARLQPDGEVDLSFDPATGPNSNVTAVAVQTDGKVVIGGAFTAVDGVPRSGVARLLPDGSLDAAFDPGAGPRHTNATTFVTALLPQPDGNLLVAGCFTHFANRYSRLLARLSPNGAVDGAFTSPFLPYFIGYPPTPGPERSAIYALAQQSDGRILAGGQELDLYLSGLVFSCPLARLGPNGQVDPSFSATRLRGLSPVRALALTAEGKILINSEARTGQGINLYRIMTNGLLDTSFQVTNAPILPGYPSSQATQLAVQEDGRILFATALTDLNLSTIPNRVMIGRLSPNGAWDDSFAAVQCGLPILNQIGPFWFNLQAQPGSFITTSLQLVPTLRFQPQPDGILVLAGAFDSVNADTRHRLARLDPNGTLRGRLLLNVMTGSTPRLSTAPEVESPYVIETSTEWGTWTDFRTNNYPWVPLEELLNPDSSTRFFRARLQAQP